MNILRGLKIAIIFVICFTLFEVNSVNAKIPTTGSMDCEYLFEYNGYDQKTQRVKMIIEVKNGTFQTPKFEELEVSSLSFIPSTKNESNYTNKLKAESFTNSNSSNWICNQISYSVDKTEKKDAWNIKIGSKSDSFRNLVSPSKAIYGDDLDDTPEEENPESTPSPSPTTSPNSTASPSPSDNAGEEGEKITWGSMGDKIDNANCETILGDLVEEFQKYYNWIKIIAPILLIVFGAIDFSNAVFNQGKDQLSKALSKFIKRTIAALAIFFLPMLINLLFTLPGIPSVTDIICGIN